MAGLEAGHELSGKCIISLSQALSGILSAWQPLEKASLSYVESVFETLRFWVMALLLYRTGK